MENKVFKKILDFSTKRVELFGAQYKTFGIFGLINYPIAYFILHDAMHQFNENLVMRLLAALLCVPLIFFNSWPFELKKYLPLYWHAVLLYTAPFLGFYALLLNNMSLAWLINIALGLFFLILLVDWITYCLLILIGAILAVACFDILHTFNNFCIQATRDDFYLAANLYSFAIVIGIFFSGNRELMSLRKEIRAMESLAATIAHELRTPLASIVMIGDSLKRQLPLFEEKLSPIKNGEIQKAWQLLVSVPERIHSTTRNAFTVIDMILMNLKGKPTSQDHQKCLMSACLESALHDYPLEDSQKQLIHWDKSVNFSFKGNEIYFKHVLFNLLKNALYYVKAANKGELFIHLEKEKKYNRLYFKDTGKGIAPSVLPHIFESFYSKTARGTGVGLAFCKATMQSFGGNITCESVEGKYTTFILSFPAM